MRNIIIPQYSIIMTVGPSNSGKSTLCNEILLPFLRNQEIRHKYLSSDGLRRSLIGKNLHKHDNKMMSASKGAFNLLHTELDEYTQFPINTPIAIVDSTNLSKIARNKIFEIAEKNGYNVIGLVFDYKEMDDYVKYVDANTNKREIISQVRTFRKGTMKDLEKTKFHTIYRIDSLDAFNDIRFVYEESKAGHQVQHDNVCIVGDLHGCLDEFLELLSDEKGIAIEDDGTGIPLLRAIPEAVDNGTYVHHVLIGDLVDKGPKVAELIRFIYKNRDFFTIVEGNHDRWNYNYLKGRIAKSADTEELIGTFFNSVRLFEADAELRTMFFELYESMRTFAYCDRFIATHAPCRNKHLYKGDKVSLKAMNTIRYPKSADYDSEEKYMEAKEAFFQFLIDEGEHNQTDHVFGHVMTKQIFWNRNKIGIDTGCVAGNLLSSILYMKGNRKFFVKRYRSRQPVTKELTNLFRVRTTEIDFAGLDIDLQKRLKWAAKNGVNFISGTMSPADKNLETEDLESLKKGIEYYRNLGITEFILEPKFMGSRCNMLLHISDPAKCKSFSRNGFEIKETRINANKTMEQLYIELQDRYAHVFEGVQAEYLLLDGELLPWNVMGKDLIEKEFMLAYKACNSEHDILRDTGFEELLAEFDTKYGNTTFGSESYNALKPFEQGYVKIYNGHTRHITTNSGEPAVTQVPGFKEDILHTELMQRCLDLYKHQLDIFASDGELEFKPFAILKAIKADGSEENWVSSEHTNLAMFHMLSTDPYCFISEDEDKEKFVIVGGGKTVNFPSADDAIIHFWCLVTQQAEMEGIVIKPNKAYIPGVAPYIKVRNKEYLRIVYGFDYDALPVKTERLIRNKSIRRKMETSIKEYELGRQMLDIPMKEISIDNKKWLSIAVQLITEQEGEKTLDPRL